MHELNISRLTSGSLFGERPHFLTSESNTVVLAINKIVRACAGENESQDVELNLDTLPDKMVPEPGNTD